MLIQFQSCGEEIDRKFNAVKKVLNQREIDAILGRARAETADLVGGKRRAIEPCNFRNDVQMSDEYARCMSNLHEAFARTMANSLGAYLRAHFEMVLASVELIPGRDFLGGFQETGFTSLLAVEPGASAVLLQVDTALVVPIIDVLLGGTGQLTAMSRDLTEIDREIMDGVAQMIGRQLETTWQSIGVKLRLDRQRQAAQIQSVYSATEKLTILSFEAKVNQTSGAIVISFPATLAIAMLREISSGPNRKVREGQPQPLGVRASVLNCPFETTVGLANLRVPLRELVALRPGSVLNLRLPVKSPAALLVGGRECFEAVPVRSGNQRAAQLVRPNAPPSITHEKS